MLTFVTTNLGKVAEAREYLGQDVAQEAFDYPEVQAADLATVAAHGARAAYEHLGGPVIVDDSGLTVSALGGFPGPYSSFVEDTLGVERVWRLAEPEGDRSAAFRAVVAYCDGDGFAATPEPVDRGERRGQDLAADERDAATTDEQVLSGGDGGDDAGTNGSTTEDGSQPPVKLFEGVVPGDIVAPRGEGGFGFDPIFEYDGRTFAELATDEKNAVSHRGRALGKFAEWYANADR
jgi:XTP/dITP diphosphohydrolase